jgi:hypothetical protein
MLCCVFVCGCEYVGGKQKYVRKCPKQQQKVLSKRTGCHFRLVIKFYLTIPIILGHIKRDYDYEMRIPDLIHTHISHRAQVKIKIMLQQKIDLREIVYTWLFPEDSSDLIFTFRYVTYAIHCLKIAEIISSHLCMLDKLCG